jgi:predicted YcjX-like family ATPase
MRRIAARRLDEQNVRVAHKKAVARGLEFHPSHVSLQAVHHAVGAGFQLFRIHRLQQVIERLAAQGIDRIFVVGRAEDHLERAVRKAVKQLEARLVRHPDVEKHHVR